MGTNSVTIDGTVVAQPELRYTPNGKAVCDMRIAHNTKAGDKEESYFFDVTIWGYAAESACEKCDKGTPVRIAGRLQTESWDDRETGKKRSKVKIVSFDIPAKLLFKAKSGDGNHTTTEKKQTARPQDSFDDNFKSDEIPF